VLGVLGHLRKSDHGDADIAGAQHWLREHFAIASRKRFRMPDFAARSPRHK
jgi:hypothetical protein